MIEEEIFLVYLPLKLDKAYFYKAKKDLALSKGDVVLVPLRNKEIYGIIQDRAEVKDFDVAKIKSIIKKSEDIPALSLELMKFLEWLSSYTISNFGNVLKMAISVAGFDFNYQSTNLSLSENWEDIKIKTSPKRQQVIDFLKHNNNEITKANLIKALNISSSVIDYLLSEKVIVTKDVVEYSTFQKNLKYKPCKLRQEQKDAANKIINIINQKKFQPIVLQGVTGSGKTEVYFETMARVLNEGGQVLIMLPEIALSTQLVSRFEERFGVKPYVWHSSISKRQKKGTWICANNGNLKVVIGARSSLFLPFANLGLIIVDEEHDQSYKQEEGVIYNARDMAILRAKLHNIPIILSSATPSLESINNVRQKRYQHFELKNRHNLMMLPIISILDMREEKLAKGNNLSEKIIKNMQETLQRNEQILLFLNKRGYASCALCKNCGEKITCKQCAINLVKHQHKNSLDCHYCGYSEKFQNYCPHCENKDSLILLGLGVEKLKEEVESLFPEEKVLVISSDTITSHVKAEKMVTSINNLEYKILIGTQIISKGYHFPKLTMVGIVECDNSYSLDLKSNEKTWQLLYQVAGRAGREELEGKVFLQTYNPQNILFDSLKKNDYEMFLENEFKERKKIGFPPYGKLGAIIISAKDLMQLNKYCDELLQSKPQIDNVEILGYAEAPISYLRGYYRNRFLIKSTRDINIQTVIKEWFKSRLIYNNFKIQIDIDPVSFY